MSNRTLGSLADLAKIIEEASNPESALREDRRESKPKVLAAKKHGATLKTRSVDPKRKAWYDKRLREQSIVKTHEESTEAPVEPLINHGVTKAVATKATAGLLKVLATANKPKAEPKSRTEAWRRKPGDPVF